MAFQTSVNLYNSSAVVGDRASQNPIIYTPVNFIAGSAVDTGSFVWRSTTNDAQAVATGTGTPMGIVERVMGNYNFTINSEGSVTIPQYGNLTVARKGDFWIKADATATVGATVYATLADGKPTLTSGDGVVDSGFKVVTAGASGDMIIVSNW